MTPDACASLVAGTPKGDPIEAARVAGIMAVKRTPDLLPFCHPVAVTGAEVAARLMEDAFDHLEAPVVRVTGWDIPYPPATIENAYLPTIPRILDAIDRVVNY